MQTFLLFIGLCSEPYRPPLEASAIGFFQEYVGKITKGEATADPKINYFRQYADKN